jgi:hypothetical protein
MIREILQIINTHVDLPLAHHEVQKHSIKTQLMLIFELFLSLEIKFGGSWAQNVGIIKIL